MKKRFLFCLIALFFVCSGVFFAQSMARRTATRCLKSAKASSLNGMWQEVLSYSKMGIDYDEGISDLWYYTALAQSHLGKEKSLVLETMQKAIELDVWLDYNKDAGRILYADLLSDTRNPQKAIDVLDSKPLVYSADAELIRVKSYYRIGDNSAILDARMRADTARRVYPEDSRFALVFFLYEYYMQLNKGQTVSQDNLPDDTKQIATAFSKSVSNYKDTTEELEVLAAIFSNGEDKVRALQSCAAKNYTTPLFALASLRAGILTEHEALLDICAIADKKVWFVIIEDFARTLKDDNEKKLLADYLNSYEGTLVFDTDNDLVPNVIAKYHRGRPQKVEYDSNQDEIFDWVADCDFGTPCHIYCQKQAMNLQYSQYPNVKQVSYGNENQVYYDLVLDTLVWTPLEMQEALLLKKTLAIQFFVPIPNEKVNDLTDDVLIAATSSYEIPSLEKDGAKIRFTVLNGKPQSAQYIVENKVYAIATFASNIPITRKVDLDNDGRLELTEEYYFDKNASSMNASREEERQVMINIFGLPIEDSHYYLKRVRLDMDGDTKDDFIEEYTAGGGRIASWDTNHDGKWNIRYEKQAINDNGAIIEKSTFYVLPQKETVTITSRNGVPETVSSKKEGETNTKNLTIYKDDLMGFYWIEKKLSSDFAKKCIDELNAATGMNGMSISVEQKNALGITETVFAVRVGDLYFGYLMGQRRD